MICQWVSCIIQDVFDEINEPSIEFVKGECLMKIAENIMADRVEASFYYLQGPEVFPFFTS